MKDALKTQVLVERFRRIFSSILRQLELVIDEGEPQFPAFYLILKLRVISHDVFHSIIGDQDSAIVVRVLAHFSEIAVKCQGD